MFDQAKQLRQLMRHAAESRQPASDARPWRIAVCGAKGGVGTTTVAVNLAVRLAQLERRTAVVDADREGADRDASTVAALCGLTNELGLASGDRTGDLVAARRPVHDAPVRGPGGIYVLSAAHFDDFIPSAYGANASQGDRFAMSRNASAESQFFEKLNGLAGLADVAVIDAGRGRGPEQRRWWRAADCVLLVTTPDDVAVMDAYATIKVLTTDIRRHDLSASPSRGETDAGEGNAAISLVVNRADETLAADVYRRLSHVCRRFLGISLGASPSLPDDPNVPRAGVLGIPFVQQTPRSEASRAMSRLAEQSLAASTPQSTHVPPDQASPDYATPVDKAQVASC